MTTVTIRRSLGATAVLLGILALVLAGLWPARLGGASSYVTTSGNSMQPTISEGDLVVVSPADHYAVGDVVAYRSSQLDTVVLHRIAAVDEDRYVFQGDSNTWVDPEQVAAGQLVGRMRAHVPGAGRWLAVVFRPWVFAFVVGVLAYLMLDNAAEDRRDRYAPRHLAATPRPFAL